MNGPIFDINRPIFDLNQPISDLNQIWTQNPTWILNRRNDFKGFQQSKKSIKSRFEYDLERILAGGWSNRISLLVRLGRCPSKCEQSDPGLGSCPSQLHCLKTSLEAF